MTVPLDDEAVKMGARIRNLRKARGLTLVQLAAASGTSQPFLSLVERGHARLSLASMTRVATEFGVQPSDLLAHQPSNRVTSLGVDLVPSDHRDRPEGGGRAVWQLAQHPSLEGVELFGSETEFSEFASHDDRDEFVYVLAGTLEVELVEGAIITGELGSGELGSRELGAGELAHGTAGRSTVVRSLPPGSSITFAAGVPHGWRAAGPEGYRVLVVTARK